MRKRSSARTAEVNDKNRSSLVWFNHDISPVNRFSFENIQRRYALARLILLSGVCLLEKRVTESGFGTKSWAISETISGRRPTTIMEAVTNSVKFWQLQKRQEIAYLDHTIVTILLRLFQSRILKRVKIVRFLRLVARFLCLRSVHNTVTRRSKWIGCCCPQSRTVSHRRERVGFTYFFNGDFFGKNFSSELVFSHLVESSFGIRNLKKLEYRLLFCFITDQIHTFKTSS